MLGFIKSFVAPGVNPIGVDFGTDCLRMAQIQVIDGEPRIVAAASADVPTHVRNDPSARNSFFVETVRDLLSQGKFKGRQAVLALPAAQMYIQHLRIPRGPISLGETAEQTADRLAAIVDYLAAGDVYQVNYTIPFVARDAEHLLAAVEAATVAVQQKVLVSQQFH